MKNKSILHIDAKWRDVADLEVDFFFPEMVSIPTFHFICLVANTVLWFILMIFHIVKKNQYLHMMMTQFLIVHLE